MTIITRFAPSPTGYLHIGGARTALFNFLYARHMGGKYLLRIEDTDRERSTEPAVDAIFAGLKWLGIEHDGEAVLQFARKERHKQVALQMVEAGTAYYCYTPQEELQAFRAQAVENKSSQRYISPWRDPKPGQATPSTPPVVRLRAPLTGEMVIDDATQGTIKVAHQELDDLVLLRSDGTPTYMLAVVVDDHDMGVTHIIRGDDHLTNAFRQKLIYQALGWGIPLFAHIPLIHGPDGTKLSKRHGAMPVDEYRSMGFLPEAVCNYLLRLGWSHGDAEIISQAEAIKWFDLPQIGKSPGRFDMQKLLHLNAHYIKEATPEHLAQLLESFLSKHTQSKPNTWLIAGLPGLQQRATTLIELAEAALIYVDIAAIAMEEPALAIMAGEKLLHQEVIKALTEAPAWNKSELQAILQQLADANGQKLGNLAGWMRVALTHRTASPSVFEIMEALGKDESLRRLGQ